MSHPAPTDVILHAKSRTLELRYADGSQLQVPFELMRVYSPSAEVQGHSPSQRVLQTGKRDVGITALRPVGHYAVQPTFSDGHESGIFSWDYLYKLGTEQEQLWQQYEDRLSFFGRNRDDPMPTDAPSGCASHGQGA